MTTISNWAGGVQWLFFMFINTVVIPLSVGSAFGLPPDQTAAMLQLSFLVTGAACFVQALFGHRRPVMEGQSGLWWGVVLSLCYMAPSQGMTLQEVGGSLSVGMILSGAVTFLAGATGFGAVVAKWFNAGVMGVFTLLLAVRLNSIFFTGMLGVPFQVSEHVPSIQLAVTVLSCIVVAVTVLLTIRGTAVSQYALLIGIGFGWLLYEWLPWFEKDAAVSSDPAFDLFLLGAPSFHMGIIATALIAGVLNLSNTYGAVRGTDAFFSEASSGEYRRSFMVSGVFSSAAGLFGLVPYAPYVSSIGFLSQSRIFERLPFLIGSSLFMIMGVVPAVGRLMSGMPLSVGSAALLVAYVRLLQTALGYFAQVDMTVVNVYKLALPLFVGITLLFAPAEYFLPLPDLVQPLIGNGLLMGILLSLLFENVRIGRKKAV